MTVQNAFIQSDCRIHGSSNLLKEYMAMLDILHENIYHEKLKFESTFFGLVCPDMRATPKVALTCQGSLWVVLGLLPD